MMFADVVLQSLRLTSCELAEMARVSQSLVSCLLVSSQISRKVVTPVTQVTLVFDTLMNRFFVEF